MYNTYQTNPSHDDLLFMAQLLTRTECLMRLGELTWPDKITLRDYRKVSMHHTVSFHTDALSFWLPGHKADQFFEGNRLILRKSLSPDTYSHFASYLTSRDHLFRAHPELWLCADGTIPTCSWFINRLCHFFPNSIAGQSMHAAGLTMLAEAGVAPNLIQAAGHWTSETFNHYIRKNPFLFKALLIGHSSLHL